MFFDQPIIIVPENMTIENCQHIVLDAGHISVESNLADNKVLNEVKARENQEYNEEDYERLESLMYDKYYIKLESAQVRLGFLFVLVKERWCLIAQMRSISSSWDRVSRRAWTPSTTRCLDIR